MVSVRSRTAQYLVKGRGKRGRKGTHLRALEGDIHPGADGSTNKAQGLAASQPVENILLLVDAVVVDAEDDIVDFDELFRASGLNFQRRCR